MPRRSRIIPVLLVSAAIVLGIAIILVSLHSNRLRMERETALAAAKYDGESLLSQFREAPASSIDFLEMDSGPDHPDLRDADQAWTTWKQSFSTTDSFAAIVEWYRSRLLPLGWKMSGSEDPGKADFVKDNWTFTLLLHLKGNEPSPVQFQRVLSWRTTL